MADVEAFEFADGDEQLTCKTCKQPFTFTQKEKDFFRKNGFKKKPNNCLPCRKAKRAQKDAAVDTRSDYQRDNYDEGSGRRHYRR